MTAHAHLRDPDTGDLSPALAAFAAQIPSSNGDVLARCFRGWAQLIGDTAIPRKRAFDITRMPPAVWPILFMLEVFDRGQQFRYKVVGTEIVQNLDRDVTAERVPAWACPSDADRVLESYRHVVRSGEPVLASGRVPHRPHRGYTYLALPLKGDNEQVTHILGAVDFYTAAPA
jgi:hypothetical protein